MSQHHPGFYPSQQRETSKFHFQASSWSNTTIQNLKSVAELSNSPTDSRLSCHSNRIPGFRRDGNTSRLKKHIVIHNKVSAERQIARFKKCSWNSLDSWYCWYDHWYLMIFGRLFASLIYVLWKPPTICQSLGQWLQRPRRMAKFQRWWIWFYDVLPSGYVKIAIENGHL